MECIAKHRVEINEALLSVGRFSFEEKSSPFLSEDKINEFLDSINSVKTSLVERTARIQHINEELEKLTWLGEVDDSCKKELNTLISLSKDLRTTLIRGYILLKPFRDRGIAKEEIKNFKGALDDLKESYDDLESVFFYLPQLPEFKEISKLLSLI